MTGDVLYINNSHWDIAGKIISDFATVIKPKAVLAIGGESGSGKSCVSYCLAQLAKKQGLYAKVLQLDNYYLVPARRRQQWRKSEGVERVGFDELNWDLLSSNVTCFKQNLSASLPLVDLLCELETTQLVDFNQVDLLIVEGLYAFKCQQADAKFYIDVIQEDVVKAQKLRNKEPLTPFRHQILMRERELVQQLKPMADFSFIIRYDAQKEASPVKTS